MAAVPSGTRHNYQLRRGNRHARRYYWRRVLAFSGEFHSARLLGADPLRCTGELRHEASAGDAGDLYVDHTVATRWLSARRYSRSGAQEKAS